MDKNLTDAIIVAAHPDDEILWFSSIIQEVRQIVICYLGQPSQPEWTKGREKTIADYPLKNVNALGLELADVFNTGDWQYPETTAYGMEIHCRATRKERYESNYQKLIDRLGPVLANSSHVFTHNPWGEYGHEEHVQVYRAVEALQKELGFTLWVSNHVSNRSLNFMRSYLGRLDHRLYARKTNKNIAHQIRTSYMENGCWTWYPEYQWCDEDVFLKVRSHSRRRDTIGKTIPLNLLDVGEMDLNFSLYRKSERLIRKLCRIRNRYYLKKDR